MRQIVEVALKTATYFTIAKDVLESVSGFVTTQKVLCNCGRSLLRKYKSRCGNF